MATIPLRHDIDYPESDGQPMGETDLHRKEMTDLINALDDRYREMADVYVAGNLFLYYVPGDRRAVVCPDVFLVKGVPKKQRRTYRLWEEEGRAPSFVIEVTSLSTRDEDLRDKKMKYEMLGVEEYFLHDPFGEYLTPALQGSRLVEGRYRPLSPSPDGSLISNVTGLRLRPEGQQLRLIDLKTGEPLLWEEEVREQARERRAAEARAVQAEDALRAAEEELARLRRELEGRNSG